MRGKSFKVIFQSWIAKIHRVAGAEGGKICSRLFFYMAGIAAHIICGSSKAIVFVRFFSLGYRGSLVFIGSRNLSIHLPCCLISPVVLKN